MTVLATLIAVMMVGSAFWMMSTSYARKRSGPNNNWQNEDYAAREAEGTWTEGSTYSKSLPGDSTGMGL